MSQVPILYSFRRCPYAMRARLAIKVSGQQCELREILLRDKAPEFLEASPKGTVPVLVLPDGTVLEESLDLMHWALAQNDPKNWLQPETETPEEMYVLIERCETEFKPNLDRYKYPNRYEGAEALTHRSGAMVFLEELNERLDGQPYLFGSRVSLADMAILPFVRQFAHVDRGWFFRQPNRNVIDWLNRFLESPLFLSIMDKHKKWEKGDKRTFFPTDSVNIN